MADDKERIRDAEERSARVDVTLARRLQESLEKQFALQRQVDELMKDRARIDFLEEKSKKSITGVSVEVTPYRGWRVMWYHMIGDFYETMREAIDRAIITDKRTRDAAGQ